MTNPRDGFRCIYPVRIRYGECDMQSIMFNANYLAIADVGITEYFRAIAGGRADEGDGGFLDNFIETYGGDNWVRHADVDFRGSVRADDLIDVCTRITRFGNTSYTAQVHMVRDQDLLNIVTLTYVWFDPKTDRVIPVGPKFIDDVMAYETVKPERAGAA